MDQMEIDKTVIDNGEYKAPVKTEQTHTVNGDRIKVFRKRTFKNGVVKSDLIGMAKGSDIHGDRNIMYDRGVDWSKI